jgi:hypothetical protein
MGLSNPIALAFSVLYVVLFALYLWERHQRRTEVPSLLLWQSIPDAVVRTSRFRPDILFFLQLLLLTALIGALARPHLTGAAGAVTRSRHVYVLDASASMQAREGRRTRFDEARLAIRDRVEGLSAATEVMLIVAAHHPAVALPFTRDHGALLRRLEELEPWDTGTNLDLALAVARRAVEHSHLPTRVELFTDAPVEELPAGWQTQLAVHQLGETDDNLAIDGLQVFQGRFQDPRDVRAQVYVHNFSHREAHGFLTVRLEDHVITRRGFSLDARAVRGFPVDDFPGPGVLRADLEVDDALAADNRAWGWIRPARVLDVAVVSDPSPLLEELAAIGRSTPNLRFRFVVPSEYERSPTVADVVVFDRFVPRATPAVPSLYLFPERDAEGFVVRGASNQLPVVDWDERHPILRHLRPDFAYTLREVRLLTVPDWMDVLLRTRHGSLEAPLAFAGERHGRRVVGTAFNLASERLLSSDNVPLLLFFLSTLQWLSPPTDDVSVVKTGEVEVLENLPRQDRRIVDPRLRASVLAPGEPVRIETQIAGEYRVRVDGTERRVLANLFDPAESDIGRARKLPFSEPPLRAPRSTLAKDETPLTLWLCLLAAILFAGEWWVASRSR